MLFLARPLLTIFESRSVSMLVVICSGESRNSMNFDLPLTMSRRMTSVHLSPTISSVVVMGQLERNF